MYLSFPLDDLGVFEALSIETDVILVFTILPLYGSQLINTEKSCPTIIGHRHLGIHQKFWKFMSNNWRQMK